VGEIVPGTEWVSADAILIHSGAATDPASASAADRAWAEACAAAVNGGIDARLEGALLPDDPAALAGSIAELTWTAQTAGVESYKRREATFGITGYVDLQGAAIRVARDYLESVAPILERYATRGLA
jgi:hypothetical protein